MFEDLGNDDLITEKSFRETISDLKKKSTKLSFVLANAKKSSDIDRLRAEKDFVKQRYLQALEIFKDLFEDNESTMSSLTPSTGSNVPMNQVVHQTMSLVPSNLPYFQ